MACPSPTQLSALAEGRVSASVQAILEAHLGRCERCRALHAELADFEPTTDRHFVGGDEPTNPRGRSLPAPAEPDALTAFEARCGSLARPDLEHEALSTIMELTRAVAVLLLRRDAQGRMVVEHGCGRSPGSGFTVPDEVNERVVAAGREVLFGGPEGLQGMAQPVFYGRGVYGVIGAWGAKFSAADTRVVTRVAAHLGILLRPPRL